VIRDLEIWVRGNSRSFKMVPFETLSVVYYSPSIVTLALSCISYEIKPNTYPLTFGAPVRRSPSQYCHPIRYRKTRIVGLSNGERNPEDMYNRLHTIRHVTDGWTDIFPRHSPRYAYAVKIVSMIFLWGLHKIDRKAIFVDNRDFSLPHLHSRPP